MNREKATDYLSRVNWKSLVEWITAEVILNRPVDPLQYCRDIIGAKISERTNVEYRPEQITDWLRNCYTEATALVDENGIIHGKNVPSAQQSLSEQITELKKKSEGLNRIFDATTNIALLDPLLVTANIVTEACRILECDRATVFTVDSVTQELVLSVAEGARDIRVPIGQGIAGTVAATGETINIVDAYSDPRFNSSADKATGYRTTTILCMPIKFTDGRILGVLQAINKRDAIFGVTDELIMGQLATQAGIALQNSNSFRSTENTRDRYRALLDIIRSMQAEMGLNSLIFTITQRTARVVEADRCTLYLIDSVQKGLFAMQGEVNIRISMDQGIAGYVATTGQTLNIPDAYDNPNFNQAIDKKTGYRTKSILCMPIKFEDAIIGVLQLINKTTGSAVFTEDDEDVMTVFLAISGPILVESKLYSQIQGKGKAKGDEPKKSLSSTAEGGEEE